MHCGQTHIHSIDDSSDLIQGSSFFSVSAIHKGIIMKVPNVDQQRKPALRFKKLDEMFVSENNDKMHLLSCSHQKEQKPSNDIIASLSLNCNRDGMKKHYPRQVNCLIEDDISTLNHASGSKMDSFFSNEAFDKHDNDDCNGEDDCIDNDDFVFGGLTLKEIQNICKTRQQSALVLNCSPKSSDSNISRCSKKRSHAHMETSYDSDLDKTLGSWREKLTERRMKAKKKDSFARQMASSFPASAVPVQIKKETAMILRCDQNSELATLDCNPDIAASSFLDCDQYSVLPISTESNLQNNKDVSGIMKVKIEMQESSPCGHPSVSAIRGSHNQNDLYSEPSKVQTHDAGSYSPMLQDSCNVFDEVCLHPGKSSYHVGRSLDPLPVKDEMDYPEGEDNKMLDAIHSEGGLMQNVEHANAPNTTGESLAKANVDKFHAKKDKLKKTSNRFLSSGFVAVQSTFVKGNLGNPLQSQPCDGIECSFKFVSTISVSNSFYDNDESKFTESHPVMDNKSLYPKQRIISVGEKDGELDNTEGCLEKNNEHAHVPLTICQSTATLMVNKAEAKKDKLNISSEVPTSEFLEVDSTTGTGNLCSSPHSLLDCSKDCLPQPLDTRPCDVADKSPVVLDKSSGCSPHVGKSLAAKEFSDIKTKRSPKKLFVKRKAISPASQEKLCQAMDAEELYNSVQTSKHRQRICFDKWTKNSAASPGVGLEGVATAEPVSKSAASVPSTGGISQSSNSGHFASMHKNLSPPLATKGILKSSCRPCIVSCICDSASIRSYSQKAIDFSQRQMRDIECLASKLVRELKSLTSIVEENLLSETCLSPQRYSIDEVKTATNNAAEVEETTRKWLYMMARDCSRFCKIMKVKEKKPIKVSGLPKEQKKITFADEAGGMLCHVKVFEDNSASSSVLGKD